MPNAPSAQHETRLSVIAPAHNEEDNVEPLVHELHDALTPLGIPFEFVLVDDGSTDETRSRAAAMCSEFPWVRVVAMTNTPKGSGNGQSAAFAAGFRAARGDWIATLDADLQNNPADLPAMWTLLESSDADFVQGDRTAARAQGDAWIRRVGSKVGRAFRRALLGDTIADTGCSLRIMRREIAVRLPLEFKGAHRFIPATARHMGYTVVETPVSHRARHAGEPKYGAGIAKRAVPGLIDLFAVRWMRNRRRPTTAQEHTPETTTQPEHNEQRENAHA